jgi:hypothetical protein
VKNERRIGKVLEETITASFLGTILAFAWRDWEKPLKVFLRIAGVRVEILTLNSPNTKQGC